MYDVVAEYIRISYTNGSIGQTSFRLQTIFHSNATSTRNAVPIVPDPILLDAFGRLRISEPVTLFEHKNTHVSNAVCFDQNIIGTANAVRNSNDSTVVLSTLANGDSVTRQSRRYITYQPGKSLLVMMTGVLNARSGGNQSGTVAEIGYFDDSNGVFFRYSDSTLEIIKRSSVTGSVVDTNVDQVDWNLDKLDGTGNSGVTLQADKAQIFVFDFEWLGVGRVRVGIAIGG